MTQNYDKKSVDLTAKILEKKGFTDVKPTYDTDQFAQCDIMAHKDGLVLVEVKHRLMASDKWGDVIIDKHKLDYMKSEIEKGNAVNGYVFEYYWDGVGFAVDVNTFLEKGTEQKMCKQKTTVFRAYDDMVEGTMVSIPQDECIKFNYPANRIYDIN